MADALDDCHIVQIPKPRSGRTKFWCMAHDASATARFGGRMPRCEGAYQTTADFKTFNLDPDQFAGGVALWGSVGPVYNSSSFDAERGIHVHARTMAGGTKAIDHTYDAVELTVTKDLLLTASVMLTGETAVSYYLSRFLKRPLAALFCPYCQVPHLDSDWFAVKPHRTHLCHGCHRLFKLDTRQISNPLEAVRHKFGDNDKKRVPRRARRALNISQSDYPGGLQIWASNPALLWTSSRAEEEGIHVHGWKGSRLNPELDGTYNSVTIDGMVLNETHLRQFMAQNALVYLRKKVKCVTCTHCGSEQFDAGDVGFKPKQNRHCTTCDADISKTGRGSMIVSNPFVNTIAALTASRIAGEV